MTIHFETISELPEHHRKQVQDALTVKPLPSKSVESMDDTPKRTSTKKKASDNASGITEAELQKEVISFLHSLGYKILVTGAARIGHGEKERYITPYRANGKGFPDVFAVKPGAKYPIIALELKSDVGKASPEQVEWLLRLALCGVHTGIVTPELWPKIKEQLEELK